MMFEICFFLLIFFCIALIGLLCKRRTLLKRERKAAKEQELFERSPVFAARCKTIRTYLSRKFILTPLRHRHRDAILREMLEYLKARERISDVEAAFEALCQREEKMSTCLGDGVACPHARTPMVQKLTTILGVAKSPVAFGKGPQGDCRIIVLTLVPPTPNSPYMPFISAMLARLSSQPCRQAILSARSAKAVRKALLS